LAEGRDPDTAAQRWARSEDVAVVASDERVVVLDLSDPATARPLVMEGPGAAIWRALDEPGTTAEVSARVAADFGIPAAEVRADVESFLSLLEAQGLVRIERLPRSDGRGGGLHDT
jgi:hypothetical protein